MADNDSILIDERDIHHNMKAIRRALHIGLAAYGEIERIKDDAERAGVQLIHPTGADDTIGEFADALRLLEVIEGQLLAQV